MAFSTGRLDSSLHDSKQTDFSVSPLTLPAPCISESCIKMKIDLKFYFSHFFVVPQKVYKTLILSLCLESGREGLMPSAFTAS